MVSHKKWQVYTIKESILKYCSSSFPADISLAIPRVFIEGQSSSSLLHFLRLHHGSLRSGDNHLLQGCKDAATSFSLFRKTYYNNFCSLIFPGALALPSQPHEQVQAERVDPPGADLPLVRHPLLLRLFPRNVRGAQGQAHRLPAGVQILLHEPRMVIKFELSLHI